MGGQGSHGEFLSLKGTPWSDCSLYLLKGYKYYAISVLGDTPAKRVRALDAKRRPIALLAEAALGFYFRVGCDRLMMCPWAYQRAGR